MFACAHDRSPLMDLHSCEAAALEVKRWTATTHLSFGLEDQGNCKSYFHGMSVLVIWILLRHRRKGLQS